jgi:hypothetical protein
MTPTENLCWKWTAPMLIGAVAASGPSPMPGPFHRPPPKPASVPVRGLGFRTVTECLAWFGARHPGVRVTRLGPAPALAVVSPLLAEFDRLAGLYPEATGAVAEIRAAEGGWAAETYAEATPAAIAFAPRWFARPQAWAAELAADERSGFHPRGCRGLAYVMAHEVGHFVGRWLADPEVPPCSQYGRVNRYEAFAEAFAVLARGAMPLPPAARQVQELIRLKRAGRRAEITTDAGAGSG